MKANRKVIGITLAAAGALVYPAIKLNQYIAKRRAGAENAEEHHELKPQRLMKHAKHSPHHRVAHN